MLIDSKLLGEIKAKRKKIQSLPEYFAKRAKWIEKSLRSYGDVHSYWLEHPEQRARILEETGTNKPRELKMIARLGIERVQTAWRYLLSIKDGRQGFSECITPKLIIDVGGIIDPQNLGYRQQGARLFPEYPAPNPMKIPDMVEEFCRTIKATECSFVERAILAHLNLAAIQPLNDGNKRTGRILQDRILYSHSLPPALIPAGERVAYQDVLLKALTGLRDHNSNMQRGFFNYVGGKVNTALDLIINDLDVRKK